MKYLSLISILIASSLLMLIAEPVSAQNVAINATGYDPDASSMLDVQSSNKGILIPQISLLSLSDGATITSPAHSLLIYNNSNTYVSKGYYYNSGTTGSPVWVKLATSSELLSMSAIGATPNANGASISGSSLTLQPADGTYGGIITTGTQTFAGAKTFSGTISASNLSGTNTGDNAVNSLYSGLVSNATHTGDATGSTALTVVKINGTSLAGLATGILKNTTGTGVPSIATGSDIPNISESQVTNLTTDLGLKAPLASPTFTGTVVIPTPFTIGATSMTSTGTQLNYLNAATGTTGTTSTNLVFSTSPLFTTPRLASTSTSGYVWTATDASGNGSWQNVTEWNRAGNTGTTPGTDFIGTTDAKDLVIKTNGSSRVNISSAGITTIGDGTNYTSIEADGSLFLAGTATAFTDIVVPLFNSRLGNTNQAQWVQMKDNGSASRGVYTFTFSNQTTANEEEVFFSVQLPHNWKEGSAIEPHVHWAPQTTGQNGAIVWGLEYTWVNYVQSAPIAFPNTSIITTTTPSINGTADADKHMITSFASLTPSNTQDKISSILMCRFFRKSGDAADTYNGNAAVLSVDFHYEIDGFGSHTQFVK